MDEITISYPGIPLPAGMPARPRLLVVDDQPGNIQILYQLFHDDHEVFMATSGQQALEFCKQTTPDLILMDIMMPKMDGLEVCRRLKADSVTQEIPVIFVTAQNNPAEEIRGLEVGAVDFITRPLNPAVVRARVRTHLIMKHQADLLRSMAFIDGLTGVPNRRHFDGSFQNELRRCGRHHSPIALIMADIDFFKQYNDTYGHVAGDGCLQQVASTLRRTLSRPYDLVVRYGGEEFACMLPETELAGALEIAEEMRCAVQDLSIVHSTSSIAPVVTISLGVAVVRDSSSAEAGRLLTAADEQLYEAKKSGRNRVCGAEL
jgi:diguanylate cyclase (GGDEF)-like protein